MYGHVASLESSHQICFNRLIRAAEWFLDNANPQEIANCVWACGKLGIKSPNLFRLMDKRAESLDEDGNPLYIDGSQANGW